MKISAIILTALCIVAFCLNSIVHKTDYDKEEFANQEDIQNKVNITVALRWTGNVTLIGREKKPGFHRIQLKEIIKDKISELIAAQTKRDDDVNLSFSFFGLGWPENRGRVNPDFKKNYIKTFSQLQNLSHFNPDNWIDFINRLTGDNIGKYGALTVAKELSTILAYPSGQIFDKNYLIFISDGSFNVSGDEEITTELRGIRERSDVSSTPLSQKVRNIAWAEEQSKKFHRYYNFLPVGKDIHILPDGLKKKNKHFIMSLFRIVPKVKQEAGNLLEYPERIKYEYYSPNKIILPVDLSHREAALKKSGYTPLKIVCSIPDVFRKEFEPSNLPSRLEIPNPQDSLFDLNVTAYYGYDDKGLLGNHREKYDIVIPCSNISASGFGNLAFFLPVKGMLLSLHNSMGFPKGQIAVAKFWNIVMLFAVFLWAFIFFIKPPTPGVSFEVKTRSE